MIHTNKYQVIEPWYKPTDIMREKEEFACEMSREEHGFLCGGIQLLKPKKVLEVGVAEGGTTAVIMTALSELKLSSEVISVDLSAELYNNNQLETGYVYKKVQEKIEGKSSHKFLFGHTIAEWLEDIGGGIDFAIIDTTHMLPGELLDFLAIYPYLSEEAMVVLHDTNLNYYRTFDSETEIVLRSKDSVATKILLSTVVGEKYVNSAKNYLNIGAFKITDDTRNYITDIFYSLSLTWMYCVGEEFLQEYRNLYLKWYDSECINMYDTAVDNNRIMNNNILLAQNKKDLQIQEKTFGLYRFPFSEVKYGSDVVIYGAGGAGRQIYNLLKVINYCHICSWVDKKSTLLLGEVVNPAVLGKIDCEYILIAVESRKLYEEIKEEITQRGWDKGKKIVGPFVRA